MTLTPHDLEILRRGLQLRLNARGEFFCEGDAVTHPRVVAWLRRGLDRHEGGGHVIRAGEQWAYIAVDDTPLRVRGVESDEDDTLWCDLDDGRRVRLDVTTLVESERGVHCEVPSVPTGRPLRARLSNPAQMQLHDRLRWTDDRARPLVWSSERGAWIEIPFAPA
ncbi:MAG: DUF1285 domain-containing protein [Myxococcales bacterium FL481]|nr:MAG: DUF1285 domain-containing protein [Myxococcales bacterium FL481]